MKPSLRKNPVLKLLTKLNCDYLEGKQECVYFYFRLLQLFPWNLFLDCSTEEKSIKKKHCRYRSSKKYRNKKEIQF